MLELQCSWIEYGQRHTVQWTAETNLKDNRRLFGPEYNGRDGSSLTQTSLATLPTSGDLKAADVYTIVAALTDYTTIFFSLEVG